MNGDDDDYDDDGYKNDPAHGLYRPTDPETSGLAAEQIVASLARLRAEVYAFYRQRLRGTLLDVEDHFGDHGSTYRSRVPELRKLGLLRAARLPDGETEKVRQKGRLRTVWELVPREARK